MLAWIRWWCTPKHSKLTIIDHRECDTTFAAKMHHKFFVQNLSLDVNHQFFFPLYNTFTARTQFLKIHENFNLTARDYDSEKQWKNITLMRSTIIVARDKRNFFKRRHTAKIVAALKCISKKNNRTNHNENREGRRKAEKKKEAFT